jgi:transcriptional regulator with XRE-family HTH domain
MTDDLPDTARRRPMPVDKIGPAIAMWREKRGLSQAQMATACGFGRAQLSRYETGKEVPKLRSLEKMVTALNVAPDHFFRVLVELAEREDTPIPLARPVGLETHQMAAVFDTLQAALAELRQLVEGGVEQRPGAKTDRRSGYRLRPQRKGPAMIVYVSFEIRMHGLWLPDDAREIEKLRLQILDYARHLQARHVRPGHPPREEDVEVDRKESIGGLDNEPPAGADEQNKPPS